MKKRHVRFGRAVKCLSHVARLTSSPSTARLLDGRPDLQVRFLVGAGGCFGIARGVWVGGLLRWCVVLGRRCLLFGGGWRSLFVLLYFPAIYPTAIERLSHGHLSAISRLSWLYLAAILRLFLLGHHPVYLGQHKRRNALYLPLTYAHAVKRSAVSRWWRSSCIPATDKAHCTKTP